MNVSISPLAEQDIEAIGDYIAQDNPVRAVSFVESLYQQCILIPAGLQMPELSLEEILQCLMDIKSLLGIQRHEY